MSKALYRKYRSKKLSEIVGQEHITRTLERALKEGRLSHAYLFTGPKGVGKTSIARILAHEINKLPYTDETTHLDIIEIDAASNRRIDEIRDLREKVHITPTSAQYKVYIIDEVHMLTKEAFNALLKTLEEPPKHVIFILATTEAHKLPETIISRTQRFTFKPIDEAATVIHLRTIANNEGMDIDDEALTLIAQHGRGSFRDSISLLDQVGHSKKKISKQDTEKLIGVASDEHIHTLAKATLEGTPAEIVAGLAAVVSDGIGAAQAARQLSSYFRKEFVSGNASVNVPKLLQDLLLVSASPDPQAQLEIALFSANLDALAVTPTRIAARQTRTDIIPASASILPIPPNSNKEKTDKKQLPDSAKAKKENSIPAAKASSSAEMAIEEWWLELLQHIKSLNNTLYGVLRMAQPHLEGNTLHLAFGFAFHQKKVADTVTKAKIIDAIKKITGLNLAVEARHDASLVESTPPQKIIPSTSTPAAPELTAITNIFGGGEVLES